MKLVSFLADRIYTSRANRFSGLVIRISLGATIISVAVMIVTVALAEGFQQHISEKVFSFWGHIRIQEKQPGKAIIAEEIPIRHNQRLIQLLRQQPGVRSIHPFATRYALLKTREQMEGVMLKGLDHPQQFKPLSSFLQEGSVPALPDSGYSRDLLLSRYTAQRLQLKTGDTLLLYFIREGSVPAVKKMHVSGIYKTDIEDYDQLFAIGDIELIRQLNQWESDQVGGYEVFLNDPRQMESSATALYALSDFPATWDAISVKEVSPQLFDWLQMQDLTRNVLVGFMTVVALINLICCLLILVLERVRMIGLLKAIGATDWLVQRIFLRYGVWITIQGVLIGTLIALGLLWLQEKTGFVTLDETAYFMDKAAVKIIPWQVVAIGAGTIICSFLILLIPSWLVKKISPVQAIRFT
ncbi:MAG: ABC transporter permease [Sphingomonadales bacterium]